MGASVRIRGMCTLTWLRTADGYQVFFNRDELKTRPGAAPPERRRGGIAHYLAPADGEAGGTWLAVNEFGLTLGLLNGYQPADGLTKTDALSRGLLVASLADAASPGEVAARLPGAHLERFRSFRLAVFHPTLPARQARWEAGSLVQGPLEDSAMPLISSSFAKDEVVAARRAAFSATVPEGAGEPLDRHLAYHAGHGDGGPGPGSVCMHRDDAETVSFSRIVVDRERVAFFYTPRAPHHGIAEAPTATLTRR